MNNYIGNDLNYKAYENIEDLSNYKSDLELELYRNERLKLYSTHVNFIKNNITVDSLRVVEVGSGSSALLYALEKSNMLTESSLGIEFSNSRYKFAERWREDCSFKNVNNVNNDFSKVDIATAYYDLFLIVDNTFSYLDSENSLYPQICVNKAYESLKENGKLIIEVHNFSKIIDAMSKDNISYFWKENAKSNPFSYSLYKYNYIPDTNRLITESVYISRENKIQVKKEIAYVYTIDSLNQLFNGKFMIDGVFQDYHCNEFTSDSSDMVVCCYKI